MHQNCLIDSVKLILILKKYKQLLNCQKCVLAKKSAKYTIQIFVFQSVMSKNKFISYLDYSAAIFKEHANTTSPEP